MRVLVTGAAGMIGRKLTERLCREGTLGGRAITALILHDVVAPPRPAVAMPVIDLTGDLSDPGAAEALIAHRPEVVFHLAGIVSGIAEADFALGYRVNLDGTRALWDAIRCRGFIRGLCSRRPRRCLADRFPMSYRMTSRPCRCRPMGRRS